MNLNFHRVHLECLEILWDGWVGVSFPLFSDTLGQSKPQPSGEIVMLEDEYQLDFFKNNGFVRKQCQSCGTFFWTRDLDRKTCGDAPCDPYSFIGSPVFSREFDISQMRECHFLLWGERAYKDQSLSCSCLLEGWHLFYHCIHCGFPTFCNFWGSSPTCKSTHDFSALHSSPERPWLGGQERASSYKLWNDGTPRIQ